MADDVRWFDGIAARLAYRVVGEGPALVLVHDYPVHGETWRKVLPGLGSPNGAPRVALLPHEERPDAVPRHSREPARGSSP